MIVRRFRFVGNTVISTQQLERLIVDYLDRPVTFAELAEVRNAVTKLYLENGYTTSGAYIPMQTSRDGTVEIQILEGRLGAVEVAVKGRLQPSYIRSRLQRAGRGVLNVPRLLQALRLLQANPQIETITANLSASPEPGLSTLRVKAISTRSFQGAAAIDNGRNPQTGSVRRGVDLSQANLIGNTDVLAVSYRNSDGSNDTQFSYQVPLASNDVTLNLSYRFLNSWIIQEPLNQLNISSNYQQFFAGLRWPLVRKVERELALGLSLNNQSNIGWFLDGLPYPSRGSDRDGQSRVTTLSFNQEWIQRSTHDVMALRSEFGLGLPGWNTTTPYDYGADPNSPDARFLFWRSDLQYLRQLGQDVSLLGRARIQWADNPLPSVEQFGLGGLGSVEGYQTNSLLTDSGLFASLELAVPLLRWPARKAVLQAVPFAAIGYGWGEGTVPQPTVNTLGSVGLGLQVRLGQQFYGRVDYAQRLGPTPYQNQGFWQNQAVVFSVRYSP